MYNISYKSNSMLSNNIHPINKIYYKQYSEYYIYTHIHTHTNTHIHTHDHANILNHMSQIATSILNQTLIKGSMEALEHK